MRKEIITISNVIFFIIFMIPNSFHFEEFVKDKIEINEILSDGTLIKIKVLRGSISSNFPYKGALMWGEGGDINILPKTVILTIDIKLGQEKIFIPLSAYSDLGAPKQVSLVKELHSIKLIIRGSDAGGSYKAILVFENGYIIRRKVMHMEFPDEVWEETVYSFKKSE
jgi:hypothetical protein